MSPNTHLAPSLREAVQAARQSFIVVGLFSFAINLIMLAPSIYMLQVYDRVVGSRSMSTLYLLTALLVIFLGVMGVLDWARADIMRRIGNRLDVFLAPRLFDLGYRQALNSAGEQNGAQPLRDLRGIRQFMTSPGIFAFFDVPWVPVYLIVMFAFHPWVGLIGLLSMIVLVLITLLNERLTQQLQNQSEAAYAEAGNTIAKTFRNGEVITSMGMLGRLRQRWQEKNSQALIMQSEATRISSMLSNLSKGLRTLIQSLILGLGAYLAIHQEITAGMMIAGSILLGRALAPIDQLLGIWRLFVTSREQYARLNRALEADVIVETQMKLPAPTGEISIEGVEAAPPGARQTVLRGINYRCRAGVITGIIGPSAAGKSSLARVLLGIWPCQAGSIRLDGADIYTWNKEELGPYIGYLPQDIELFEGSVSENIARFGQVDPDKVVAAAKLAGIHEMILNLPSGYESRLGGTGINLSGGQRQRVGLARALYDDPKLIVLDEPNSNLDTVGEMALLKAIEILKARKVTIFIVTHKTNILSLVDSLIVLQEGQLAMSGPRDLVLAELQKGQVPATVPVPQPSLPQ